MIVDQSRIAAERVRYPTSLRRLISLTLTRRRPVWAVILCLFPWSVIAEPVSVLVCVPPQKFIVERVGGNEVQVEVLLPPGRGPETFEITPRHMMRFSKVDLFCCIGVPFEAQCLDRLVFDGLGPRILNMVEDVSLLDGHHHDHDHDHDHGDDAEEKDPHVWTSPRILTRMSEHVAHTLADLRPEHAETFHKNAAELGREFRALDEFLKELFQQVRIRSFLVVHPAWSYLASDYALSQVSIEREGKSPGPRRMALLIEEASAAGVRTVFSDRHFSSNDAQIIAEGLRGEVVELDPLAEDVIKNLRTVGRQLAEVMR